MSFERRSFLAAAGLLVAIGAGSIAGGGTAARAAAELRLGHDGAPDDTVSAAAERFKELVEAKTGGAVTVGVRPLGGEFGDAAAMLRGVWLGALDLAVAANPEFAAFEPALGVFDVPFLFASPGHAYAVLDGEIGRAVLDGLERHGMKALATWGVGFLSLTNAVRPVRGPADVSGLRIRTIPGLLALARAFELLGATPTPVDDTELYRALQSGRVDGQEGSPRRALADRLHEVQGHLSLTRHAYVAAPLVMNLQRFGTLPAEHRRALLEAAQEAAGEQRARDAALDDEAVAGLRGAGVRVVEDPDIEAFRGIIGDGMRAAFAAERHNGDVLARIDALKPTQ